METRWRAIVMLVVVAVFLFLSIAFKIITDRKRKSLVRDNEAGDKKLNIDKAKQQDKKPNLWGIPSWGQALLGMFVTFFALMIGADIIGSIFEIPEDRIDSDALFYITYGIIISILCFFICRRDPGSVWYVPLLCNLAGIITLITEPLYRAGSLRIVIYGGWALSIIASFSGAWIGKKRYKPLNK